jgi:hypothetical protein
MLMGRSYNTKCDSSDHWSKTKDYPTYRTWVRDRLNKTAVIVEKKQGCDYPEFIPVSLLSLNFASRNSADAELFQILNAVTDVFSNSSTICNSMVGEAIITT